MTAPREPWPEPRQSALFIPHDKVREAMHKWDKPVFEATRRIVFWISTTAYVCGAIGVAMIFAAVVGR